MTLHRKKLGASGEELAAQFLLARNYRILARNLKLKYGEVDILALDQESLVIVEVKTKRILSFGLPVEMVTPAKQRKLQQLALLLSQRYNMVNYRIDVIAVDWSVNPPVIDHFTNALA